MLCQGQLLPIASYTALFSLLGTTFGGDGRTTFGLPDLRGRSIVGVGSGPGLDTISWGERGGHYLQTLSSANLPPHHHAQRIGVNGQDGGTTDDPVNNAIGNSGANAFNTAPSPNEFLNSGNTADTGSGQAFNSRNPFLGIYMSIAVQGIFPSRN